MDISQIPEFQKENIHIKDPDKVEEIVTAFIKGGHSKFQVVSDFDRTITRHKFNGKVVPAIHGILENSHVMSKESKEKCQDLREHYYPICMSSTLSDEEKCKLMMEWFSKEYDEIFKTGMRKEDISKIVEQSDVLLREGCGNLLKLLADNNVPLAVCTAGITDILNAMIAHRATLYDNISAMGNKMEFDANGKIVSLGCKGIVINQYNKREMTKINRDYFEQHKDRPNVLLMGDSIGDLQLADGLIGAEYVLKIGFLNSHVDQNFEAYKSRFDIVVVDDITMDVPNAVLNKIMLSSQYSTNSGSNTNTRP